MPDVIIHMRVPASTKGRWVRASRVAGMRLTDWITGIVEAHMQQQITKITIPDGLDFADLKLSRESDGAVSFDLAVIKHICAASNVAVELFMDAPEDNIAGLIVNWYEEHRQNGGGSDPVAEDLITEMLAENAAGQNYSHKPGRA